MEMEEEFSKHTHPQHREKQQISVPYLWEEKPGIPKQGWRSPVISAISLPSPVRLVVSVPFAWEEEPGKPIQGTETVPDLLTPRSLRGLDALPTSDSNLNPFAEEEVHYLKSFIDEKDKERDTTSSTKMNGNIFRLTAAQESFSEDGSYWNENWRSASETHSHSSSSRSGVENVCADTSVVKFIFPVSSPDGGFLNEYHDADKQESQIEACTELVYNRSRKHTSLAKRTLTLAELILLSRQLSCRRKQIDVKKRSHPKECLKKSLLTCFPFITDSTKIRAYISGW